MQKTGNNKYVFVCVCVCTGDGLHGGEGQHEGPGDVGPVRGHVAQVARPVHDESRPGRRATLPDVTRPGLIYFMLLTKIVMALVTHLATPQLADKLKSLSLRIGKPGAPPNPPSDTIFLSDLIF